MNIIIVVVVIMVVFGSFSSRFYVTLSFDSSNDD